MRTRLTALLLAAAVISGCTDSEQVLIELEDITVTSPAFTDGEEIPVEHTCDGADVPPPLTWSGVPEGTAEVAVLVVDRDAPDGSFVHWAVAGIDPRSSDPEGGVNGTNSFNSVGYGGPCPPPEDEAHDYVFNVYSLARGSGLSEGFSPDELQAALDSATGAGALMGTYDRE